MSMDGFPEPVQIGKGAGKGGFPPAQRHVIVNQLVAYFHTDIALIGAHFTTGPGALPYNNVHRV